MGKRLLSCVLFLVLLTASVRAFSAGTTVSLNELRSCRSVSAYSGDSSAYFFGFTGRTLVSSRVIPEPLTRAADAGADIRCACHDDDCAYALYRSGLTDYRVLQMNMNSGACADFAVAEGCSVQNSSFAAVGGEVFVIVMENGFSHVLGCRGSDRAAYRFSENIRELFVRQNAAYAVLDGGSVYEIGGGSLRRVSVTNDNQTGFSSGGTITAHANGQTATLKRDFTCIISGGAEPLADHGISAAPNGDFLTVPVGMTVSRLRSERGDVLAVQSADGSNITSGKLKTGFTVLLTEGSLTLAVTGDIDGSGTMSGGDLTALMRHFNGSAALSAAALRAADHNGDGTVDNRDLVLIAREIE